MSITATFVGLMIIMLRKVKNVPRLGVYTLWALVLLRLIMPFYVSSRISLMNLTGALTKKVVKVGTFSPEGINLSMTNAIGTADTYFPVTYKTEQLKTIFEVATFVWIVGAVGTILAVSILYYLTSNELRKASLVKDNIYSSNMVQAPLVYGIFRQRIIIPEDYIGKEEQLKFVLLHETVHLRRHDNLLRVIAVYTACIHWFNPLVWIFIKLFIDDMELTCDMNAIKQLSTKARKQYAQTLVNASSRQQIFMSTAFGKTNVKVRVMNVMTYKKLSIFALIVTIIFIFTVGAIFLTNPVR
jgi:beta-lactamase regulating signal transducer with metallopeptidase domain